MAGKCGGLSLNHVIGNYILPQGAFFLDAGHGPQSSPHQAIVQPFLPIGEIQGSLRRAVKSRYSLSEREVSKKIQGGLVGSTSDRMSEVEIEQLLRLLPTQAIGLEMEVAYFALTCQQKEIPFGALLLIGDIIKEGTFPNPGSTVHEEYGRDHLEIIFEAIRLLDENPLSVNSRGLKTGLSTPFI
jgi:nucleoside phosphorylase